MLRYDMLRCVALCCALLCSALFFCFCLCLCCDMRGWVGLGCVVHVFALIVCVCFCLFVVSCRAGVWGVLMGLLMSNPVGAAVVGVSALSAVVFEFALGSNISTRNRKGKLNMMDRALVLRDICESTRRDVQLLDEIGGHASKIAKCQQDAKEQGLIDDLQRLMSIIYYARKMKEACLRYMERDIKDE